jgi:hypothetical protein
LFANDTSDVFGTAFPQLLSLKGQHPGQQLVEDNTERINVRPGIHTLGGHLHLLRTHIFGCPDKLALFGIERSFRKRLRQGFGDAEIDDLWYCLVVLN